MICFIPTFRDLLRQVSRLSKKVRDIDSETRNFQIRRRVASWPFFLFEIFRFDLSKLFFFSNFYSRKHFILFLFSCCRRLILFVVDCHPGPCRRPVHQVLVLVKCPTGFIPFSLPSQEVENLSVSRQIFKGTSNILDKFPLKITFSFDFTECTSTSTWLIWFKYTKETYFGHGSTLGSTRIIESFSAINWAICQLAVIH